MEENRDQDSKHLDQAMPEDSIRSLVNKPSFFFFFFRPGASMNWAATCPNNMPSDSL